MLDRYLRGRLVGGLGERYPTYDELAVFVDLRLGRALAAVSAPDALGLVLHRLLRTARAQGWLDELVEAAADDSPHSAALQEVRTAVRDRPTGPPAPGPGARPGALALDVVLVVPPRLDPLADALRADPRVGRVGSAPTAAAPDLAGADALVVSTEVVWPDAQALPPALHALPVVVVATAQPSPAAGIPVAHLLAGSVTQIVAAAAPGETARRVVDHLAAVIGWQRRNGVTVPSSGGLA